MSALPNRALAALTALRLLGGGLWPALLGLGLLAARVRWGPDPALVPDALDPTGGADLARTDHAFTLSGSWSLLLLAAGPWLLFRSAGVVPRWRRGELDWLAAAPVTRGALALSAAAGSGLAALGLSLGLLVLCTLAARLSAGPGAAPTERLAAQLETPPVLLLDATAVELELTLPEETAWLRARVFPVGAVSGVAREARVGRAAETGGSAQVRLRVARAGEEREASAAVAERTELRVPVPAGAGPVRVALERGASGPFVALDGEGLQALEAGAGALTAPLALFARTLIALSGWCALALGLGAWMGERLASALALSLLLLAWVRDDLPLGGARTPGVGLGQALALVGEGLAPSVTGLGEWLAGLALFSAGLALARAGLARGGERW